MDLNRVMLIGNITKDPQVRTTSGGRSVASFGIATNRKWKDQSTGELKEDTQFHNISAWGRQAEVCAQYLKKGAKIYVEGRLQTRAWDDQQSGQKKYFTEVLMENMIMLDRKNANTGNYSAPSASTTPSAPAAPKQNNNVNIPAPDEIPTIDLDDNQSEIKMEDIPF